MVAPTQPTLEKLVDHISHIADSLELIMSGLGLDFVKDDGLLHPDDEIFSVGENKLIPDFENEDDLPNLTEALTKRGFHEDEIVKILGGNILRMLRQVLRPRETNN